MDVVPLQQKGADQEVVTQFSGGNVEALGLLKMDFLGLRNLDVIATAERLVGDGLDVSAVPLDDRKTYEMLSRGEASGVFQFESSGMREALRQVKPTQFEDLIALVALYRPGPMQYIPAYAARKHGREQVSFPDSRLEPITGPTLGLCIYQEQYMEIAKELAGFTPAEADDLRKAIGKKIHALMASLKEKFVNGCLANGVTPAVAKQLWEDTEKSQDYSFNKSHAACYALIAYRTAWLKAHHPCEYMAALISSVMNTKDRVPFYVNACDEIGIEVLPPGRQLVAGRLRGGGGEDPLRPQRRQERRRVRRRRDRACAWGRRALHLAVGVHASASTRSSSTSVRSSRSSSAVRSTRPARHGWGCSPCWSRRSRTARSSPPTGSWVRRRSSTSAATSRRPPDGSTTRRSRAAEYEKQELLRLERETLGLYVSEHPLSGVREQLRRKTDANLGELERRRDGEIVTVGGIVSDVKHTTTKRGEPMVFLALDDPTGSVEAVVFNSTYAQSRELCTADRILVIKARVDHKQAGETKLIALELTPFEAVAERREVRFTLNAQEAPAGVIRELARLVQRVPRRLPGVRVPPDVAGAEDARARPRVPGAARLGLPGRGAGAPRRAPRVACRRPGYTAPLRGAT